MHQQPDATLPSDEAGKLERTVTERMRRLAVLLDLDQALSRAANHYSLAADLVRHDFLKSD